MECCLGVCTALVTAAENVGLVWMQWAPSEVLKVPLSSSSVDVVLVLSALSLLPTMCLFLAQVFQTSLVRNV